MSLCLKKTLVNLKALNEEFLCVNHFSFVLQLSLFS